jgi:hypothetical protein
VLTLRRSTYCLYCHDVFEFAHQRLEAEAKLPASDRRGRVWDSDSEHYKGKGRLPFCLLVTNTWLGQFMREQSRLNRAAILSSTFGVAWEDLLDYHSPTSTLLPHTVLDWDTPHLSDLTYFCTDWASRNHGI